MIAGEGDANDRSRRQDRPLPHHPSPNTPAPPPPPGARTRDKGPPLIRWRPLLGRLLRGARDLAADLTRPPPPPPVPAALLGPAAAVQYGRLRRVYLTGEVNRTLFEEYAAHRASDRGREETGWVLLGVRGPDEATVLATLPAAADRDAGEAHVWITGPAHVLASRIVRQHDRRLTMLGVVHTHPGSLRHPSKGDLRGDREWVPQLRGAEGVFGIGTADAGTENGSAPGTAAGSSPKPHVWCVSGLRFSWYTLADGDWRYHPVPVGLVEGPDLARPLRPVWGAIEGHAERLDRLARQLVGTRFEVTDGRHGPALAATAGLAEPGQAVRVVLEGKEVRYYYEAGGEVFQADLPDAPPDQGVYLLLADLAGRG
jgi:hypothetical protein